MGTSVYFFAARRSRKLENELSTSEEKIEQKHINVSEQQTSSEVFYNSFDSVGKYSVMDVYEIKLAVMFLKAPLILL
jgi:hypothetical protein